MVVDSNVLNAVAFEKKNDHPPIRFLNRFLAKISHASVAFTRGPIEEHGVVDFAPGL